MPPPWCLKVLLSGRYRTEIGRLHRVDGSWGSRGYNWAYMVAGIALIERCSTILDYGCGKGTLSETLRVGGLHSKGYDPGIAGKEYPPAPADLVVCTDVLEHIEPDCLASVIGDLVRVTRRLLFVAISTRPAGRQLSDGRNAHLIIKEAGWWRGQFDAKFEVRRVWNTGEHEWVALMNTRSAVGSPAITT